MQGYLVTLRIVRRHHEHYGLTVWINHEDSEFLDSASSLNQARENAKTLVYNAAKPSPGMVTVEKAVCVVFDA